MLGKFKDEANGQSIIEFVGWKPKMYSYQPLTDLSPGKVGFSTKKRYQATQRPAVTRLRHREFTAELDEPEDSYVCNRRIGSELLQIYRIDVWKERVTYSPVFTT